MAIRSRPPVFSSNSWDRGRAEGNLGEGLESRSYAFRHSNADPPDGAAGGAFKINLAFYDGHVENVGVRQTMRADGRVRVQTGNENWGLWSKDVSTWNADGYYIPEGYDRAATSFHILTTDGIRGRDILGD